MSGTFQKDMDQLIAGLGDRVPSLLLHSCCGPCSSYVLEYLSRYFAVTVFFYNPNIQPAEEYARRLAAQRQLLERAVYLHPVALLEGKYEPTEFFDAIKGLESCREGGERCRACFLCRLEKTAQKAAELKFDYFATTLTVSPHKNALAVNEAGEKSALQFPGSRYLPSDFKKREGFKRSIALSAEYGLYRQDYCGCVFSREQREREEQAAGKRCDRS